MTSVSADHIILTPPHTVGSGWPQRESNPGAPHQESGALPSELPRPRNYEERINLFATQRQSGIVNHVYAAFLSTCMCIELD